MKLSIFVLFLCTLTTLCAQSILPEVPRVTVSGLATAELENDIATITLTVNSTAATKDEAENNVKINLTTLSTWLGQFKGVLNVDTQNLRVQQIHNWRKSATTVPAVIGYEATVTVLCKVSASEAGQMAGSATSNGATQVENTSFSVSPEKLEKTERDLLRTAFSNAKNTATVLADSAGLALGKAFDISTSQQYAQPSQPRAMLSAMSSADSTPFQLAEGVSTVTATVQVSFELLTN